MPKMNPRPGAGAGWRMLFAFGRCRPPCRSGGVLGMKALLTEKDRKEAFPGGWKPLYWALFGYVVLVPVAYLVATIAPGRKDWPLWSYTTVMHALLCAVVAAVCKVVVLIVEQ